MATPPPDSGGIVWEDPPDNPRTRRSGHLVALQALTSTLRKNRGRWAKLLTYGTAQSAHATAQSLRARVAQHDDLADMEITGRRTPDGGAVYVRARPERA